MDPQVNELHSVADSVTKSGLAFKVRLKFLNFYFPGANAQCPANYEYIGGRCFLFLFDEVQNFFDASISCQFFGGKLAKLDDCEVMGELFKYFEKNG